MITLNDRRTPAAPPLEDVRATIEAELQDEVILEFINDARAAATITATSSADIDTDLLNHFELLEN